MTARMKNVSGFSIASLAANLVGCSAFAPPLDTVERVDLQRYAGRWYEIARYENSFEQGCVGVTADYSLRDDGRVNVVNTCVEGSLDGDVRTIRGSARAANPENTQLKVTFFWPFEGDYWVIELGDEEDYGYAVVSEPFRRFLWILNRTPQMDEELYQRIIDRLEERDFNTEQLIRVTQPEDTGAGAANES